MARRVERLQALDDWPRVHSPPPVDDPQQSVNPSHGSGSGSGSGSGLASGSRLLGPRALHHHLHHSYSDGQPPRSSEFRDLDRTLHEANSHLRALLDLTSNTTLTTGSPAPPAVSPPLRSRDSPEDARRNKRRKLDAERYSTGFKGFRYGKYGQVEPGQLHMEIVSCDGGMFSNESIYSAENLLRDNTSVYCTKGNRCNIILRHQGGTVFTLQELVIKAPKAMNYSHP